MKKRKWTEQKCWGCQKAGGGCTWSAEGEDGAIRFEPVPGWDAEQIPWRRYNSMADGYTYKIYDCPEFAPLLPVREKKVIRKEQDVSELCAACSVYTRALCRSGRAGCRAVVSLRSSTAC